MKKTVLLTGGAGFIGSHLCEDLLRSGDWRVVIVDDLNDFYSPDIKRANLAAFADSGDVEFIEGDIRDAETLAGIFAANSFDQIVHLAARAGVRPSLTQTKLYYETNVIGTLNLLELAREHGVPHFIFGSSSSVYGATCSVPFKEDATIRKPISPYAATKASGELLCHTYSHLYDIRTVCLRFFTVYGARQRPDLAIHKFTRLIAEGKPVPMFGDGTTRRDYTYIDDIIQGVRAAMDHTATKHEVLNLGESQTTELRRLIQLIEESLGTKAIVDRQPLQPGDVPITYADITRARELLGYNPKTKIEDGIPKFVEWYRSAATANASA